MDVRTTMKDCLETRGYHPTEKAMTELVDIYMDCQRWEGSKMTTGLTFDEVEDFVRHSSAVDEVMGSCIQTGYEVVLKEKPLDEGLTRSEVMDLFDILSGVNGIPMEIQGNNSTAMGFIIPEEAERMDYDFSELENVVRSILNDMENENESCTYQCPNKYGTTTIWLSR